MKHCVGSYAEDCLQGASTIWSMCRVSAAGPSQSLTVEVEPARRQIVQARGFANRLPTELELTVLKEWSRKADLDWSSIETQARL